MSTPATQRKPNTSLTMTNFATSSVAGPKTGHALKNFWLWLVDAPADRAAGTASRLSATVFPSPLQRQRTAPQARRTNDALRVVRLIDTGCGAAPPRLRISGRMADVCAELERMAHLESRPH